MDYLLHNMAYIIGFFIYGITPIIVFMIHKRFTTKLQPILIEDEWQQDYRDALEEL